MAMDHRSFNPGPLTRIRNVTPFFLDFCVIWSQDVGRIPITLAVFSLGLTISSVAVWGSTGYTPHHPVPALARIDLSEALLKAALVIAIGAMGYIFNGAVSYVKKQAVIDTHTNDIKELQKRLEEAVKGAPTVQQYLDLRQAVDSGNKEIKEILIRAETRTDDRLDKMDRDIDSKVNRADLPFLRFFKEGK